MWVGEGSTSLMFNLKKCHKAEYEYKQHMHAPRKGLAPPMLIFQTSPSCNIFTKNPKFYRNRCQPSHKGPIFGQEIRGIPLHKGLALKIVKTPT